MISVIESHHQSSWSLPLSSVLFVLLIVLSSTCFGKTNQIKNGSVTACENDTRTLADMVKAEPARSNKVPADFTIEQHIERYVVVNPTASYDLPASSPALLSAGLGSNYRDTSVCFAIDHQGIKWRVVRLGKFLNYIPASETEAEPIYDVRSRAGNNAFRACLKGVIDKQNNGLLPLNYKDNCSQISQSAADKAEKELKNGSK